MGFVRGSMLLLLSSKRRIPQLLLFPKPVLSTRVWLHPRTHSSSSSFPASGAMAALKLSLTEASQLLSTGVITSKQLTEACFQQMAAKKHLNAFVTETQAEALRQAEAADERIRSNKRIGPLDGIPLAVKDNFCAKDVRTTASSKMLFEFISPYDSTVVSRLKSAGAVLVGKTNMDEFGMGSFTTNSFVGATINPLSEEEETSSSTASKSPLTAGGSSGGSAAAVAAYCCFGAIGSDTGGSVRLPASYCGLVGMKPTYGRISRFGLIAYASSLDCPGILTRTVEDSRLILSAIEGMDPRDSTTLDEPPSSASRSASSSSSSFSSSSSLSLSVGGSLNGLRIGIPREYHVSELSANMVRAWTDVAFLLAEAGAEVVSVSLPTVPLALPAYYIIAPAEMASNLARYDGARYGQSEFRKDSVAGPGGIRKLDITLDRHQAAAKKVSLTEYYTLNRSTGFGPEVQRRILLGTFVTSSEQYQGYLAKAQQVRQLIADDFKSVFRRVPASSASTADVESGVFTGIDFLLTPTATSVAPPLNVLKEETSKNPLRDYVNDVMTVPASLAGLPAVSIPTHWLPTPHAAASGHGPQGRSLPVALQLVGPHWSEGRLLDVAAIVEEKVKFSLKPDCK